MTAAALAYLVAGFSVVATAMGTRRRLFPWIEFQSRRPRAAEMSAWYRRDPRAGVAIVCSLPDLDTSGLCLVKTLSTALTCWPYRNMALRDGARTSTRTSSVAGR